MPKLMQNLFVLLEDNERADIVSLKGGNMCMNRFCIDEDASFELSGVNYFKKEACRWKWNKEEWEEKNKEKGKEYPLLRFKTTVLPGWKDSFRTRKSSFLLSSVVYRYYSIYRYDIKFGLLNHSHE